MQLGGKVALITGAGSGIGRAAALLMAREGAGIAALDQTSADLAETVAAITQAGGAALPLTADVGDPDQMYSAVQELIAHFGRLDIVFANAGINGVWAPLEELSPADWTHTINTNLTGTFLSVKYAVPYLKRQGGAVIITSSVNGTRNFSNTGATAYACSKAAQVAFANMVALELARDQVRVNVICPGWIATNIEHNSQQRHLEEVKIPVEYPEGSQPLTGDKPGSAEQVAQLVLFLASDAADQSLAPRCGLTAAHRFYRDKARSRSGLQR